jgi:hypothetical protein
LTGFFLENFVKFKQKGRYLYREIHQNQQKSDIYVAMVRSNKSYTLRVCLDRAKNSVRIDKLRISNEDSEK